MSKRIFDANWSRPFPVISVSEKHRKRDYLFFFSFCTVFCHSLFFLLNIFFVRTPTLVTSVDDIGAVSVFSLSLSRVGYLAVNGFRRADRSPRASAFVLQKKGRGARREERRYYVCKYSGFTGLHRVVYPRTRRIALSATKRYSRFALVSLASRGENSRYFRGGRTFAFFLSFLLSFFLFFKLIIESGAAPTSSGFTEPAFTGFTASTDNGRLRRGCSVHPCHPSAEPRAPR